MFEIGTRVNMTGHTASTGIVRGYHAETDAYLIEWGSPAYGVPARIWKHASTVSEIPGELNLKVTRTDVTEWLDWERPSLPFTVIASPYGETLYREFATQDQALEFARSLRLLDGQEYSTSWGVEKVNTTVTVTEHYVTEIESGSAAAWQSDAQDDLECGGCEDSENAPHASDCLSSDLATVETELYGSFLPTDGHVEESAFLPKKGN